MFSAVIRRVFGQACAGKAAQCGNWALNKPNRLMQGFYMVIVNVSFVFFIIEVRGRGLVPCRIRGLVVSM